MDETMSQKSVDSHISSTGTNSRRKPAAESVSLCHPPRSSKPNILQRPQKLKRNDSSGSSMEVDLSSMVSFKPQWTKNSSGESSNPENWFDRSNNDVGKNESDDDPPFFLRRTSSDETPQEPVNRRSTERVLPVDTEIGNDFDDDEDSGSEGFRGVIDDLTIENQRLKRKLKKYERLHSRLDTEALFEVRVHDLPAPKKRELEEMLRNFVTKMGQTGHSERATANSKTFAPASLLPYHSSSATSRVGDSGYHSLSMSGRNSNSLTGQTDKKAQATSATNTELDNDIHNYLWDIPMGLQPQHSGPVSEKEKKKLIVRRLEQLFAGRDPSASGHQQPIQQQKLAQSAARADRRATQALGDIMILEGSRIARIMPNSKAVLTPQAIQRTVESAEADAGTTATLSDGKSEAENDEPVEQRPTRPLDLDPYRAQIPEENMEYIRHLGFSPPHFDVEAQKDGHGWIYLNVLHNMAQLHLSNVTVDFVRKSITDYSQKLEISEDGRKLRWRGGSHVTYTSSNNSPEHTDHAPTSKRSGTEGDSSTYVDNSMSGVTGQQKAKHHLAYSPLFRRDASTTDGSTIHDMSNVQGGSNTKADINLARKAPQTSENPMIFYANAGFYTDLSGDAAGPIHQLRSGYRAASGAPIGQKRTSGSDEVSDYLDSEKGPLSRLVLNTPKSATASLSSGSINIVADSTQSSTAHVPEAMDFEVSGLGGVYPADNFAINIKSRQMQDISSNGSNTPGAMRRKAYPTQIRRALQKSQAADGSNSATLPPQTKSTRRNPTFQREIMSSRQEEMPASQLPEGNFYHDSADSDSDDEMDGYSSDDLSTIEHAAPTAAVERTDWAHVKGAQSRSEESGSDEESEDAYSHIADNADDRSEESIDLLAAVRAVDPESVRIKEREFDSNIAERLADDIPPGSSAATAEGGSGFNSPNLTKDGNTGRSIAATLGAAGVRSMGPPQPLRKGSLKRQRTSGESESSMARATKSPKLEDGQ